MIPLPNVSSSVLVKVLEYCEQHKNDPLPPKDEDVDDSRRKTSELSDWDARFVQVRGACLSQSASLLSPLSLGNARWSS